MKVIGICGSPRNGNSEFMLNVVLDAANKNGAKTDKILLRESNICFIGQGKEDEFESVLNRIIGADALVFASPCYYDMISPQLLNMIDRLDPYAKSMKNKKTVILISGKEDFDSSGKNAADYLKRVFKIYEMDVIGVVFGKSEESGEIAKKSGVVSQLKKLGEKIARN